MLEIESMMAGELKHLNMQNPRTSLSSSGSSGTVSSFREPLGEEAKPPYQVYDHVVYINASSSCLHCLHTIGSGRFNSTLLSVLLFQGNKTLTLSRRWFLRLKSGNTGHLWWFVAWSRGLR